MNVVPSQTSQPRVKEPDLCSEESWTTDCGSTCTSGNVIRKLKWTDGSVYVGEVDSEGRPHGHGRLIKQGGGGGGDAGLTYEGEWVHGEASGRGTCAEQGGATYSGEWEHDNLHGYVKLVFNDGAAYEGDWRNNRPEGSGVFINPHGIMFRGEWRNGVFRPQLSNYDPRGINTCTRQNTLAPGAPLPNRDEVHLQYNGVPGDCEERIDLVAPAVAVRKGQYDPTTDSYVYTTPEYESPVYPANPTRSGGRLDSGYLYRTRYSTEVWQMYGVEVEDEAAQLEEEEAAEAAAVADKLNDGAPAKEKLSYKPSAPDSNDVISEEDRDIDPPNQAAGDPGDGSAMNKPNTGTCLDLGATQGPPVLIFNEFTDVWPMNTIPPVEAVSAPPMAAQTQHPAAPLPPQQKQQRSPPPPSPKRTTASSSAPQPPTTQAPPSPEEVVMPVPLEAVTTVQLNMPKLKVNKVKIDYPVYAPRIVEVPVAAETLSPDALRLCDKIQQNIEKVKQTPTLTMLDTIADTIVENLEQIASIFVKEER